MIKEILKTDNDTYVIDGVTFVSLTNVRDVMYLPVELTKGKMAYFIVPKNLSEHDCRIIEHYLAQIRLKTELENNPNP